jgi:spermidine synthase
VAGSYPIDSGTAELVPDRDSPHAWTLLVNGVPSSYVDLDDPGDVSFEYLETMAAVLDVLVPSPQRLDAVHIGGAGCALPRLLAGTRPRSRQVVFEIDGALVDLARTSFGLSAVPGLRIRVGDGAAGVAALPDASVDVVVRDAFAGDTTPRQLTTGAFAAEVARILRPDGVYLLNTADGPPLALARAEAATLEAHFAEVVVIGEPGLFRGRRFANVVLVASARRLPAELLARAVRGGAVPNRLLAGPELSAFVAGARPID